MGGRKLRQAVQWSTGVMRGGSRNPHPVDPTFRPARANHRTPVTSGSFGQTLRGNFVCSDTFSWGQPSAASRAGIWWCACGGASARPREASGESSRRNRSRTPSATSNAGVYLSRRCYDDLGTRQSSFWLKLARCGLRQKRKRPRLHGGTQPGASQIRDGGSLIGQFNFKPFSSA